MRTALTLATALLAASPAFADEVWESEMGQIVYEADQNGAAILSFTNLDAYDATLVIPGLSDSLNNRGVYDAYWLGTGAGGCEAFMSLPGSNEATTNWGRALVSFDKPSFPTSFTLHVGWCFDAPREAVRAVTEAD